MQNSDLVSSFAEIAREKDIDRDTLQLIVEDVFRAMIRKRYGSDDSFEIILNPDHGDMQILHIREVVEDWAVEDPVTQIEESEAQLIDEDFEEGDEVAEEIEFKDFGRRAVMTARQTFSQRIRDIEKDNTVEWYQDLVGEVVVGELYQVRRREILVMHNKAELKMPREEQIFRDRFRKGDMIRAVIKEVGRESNGDPRIVISRADPLFMERLFELEVPEIDEGLVEIKKIVREPGDRAKVAVISYDDRIDPVGACVGMKGSRIHSVVRELGNENIDVVQWTEDSVDMIKRALSPAKPVQVVLNDELDPPRAKVVVAVDEVSQAIGRGGINIRLASKLTGYEIDVYREISEEEEDIEIQEFADEIPEELLQMLRNIGCDTARAVLELSRDELMRRTGMEEAYAEHILNVIKAEFAKDEEAAAAAEKVTSAGVGAKKAKAPEKKEEADPAESEESAAAEEPVADTSQEKAGEAPAETEKAESTEESVVDAEEVEATSDEEEKKTTSEAADDNESKEPEEVTEAKAEETDSGEDEKAAPAGD
jgi:N utilization substance protein A